MNLKINFNAKLSLACKTFLCFAITMFCINIASFATKVKVTNNTGCTMQIYCQDNGSTYDMGSISAWKSKDLYVEASYGTMYSYNEETGQYADAVDFYKNYSNNLHISNGCQTTQVCDNPTFDGCSNASVLDFSENGIDWALNNEGGSYTVGEQTFDISLNDPNNIFAAYQEVQADEDDEGSFESNTGIAIGINPHNTDDVIEINYNLSQISDYVAFTIRDLDKKYKDASRQIEKVCVFGYLNGEEILPTITSLCGSVEIDGNCAVATDNSANGSDESIRIIFESCINEIKIVYGNDSSAADDPTYSRIFIGDDIGFGTAICTDACTPCTATGSSIVTTDSAICIESDGSATITDSVVSLTEEGSGENAAWVVTDASAIVIEVAASLPITVNGVNNYKVWYVNYDGELSAPLVVGANAAEIASSSECVSLGTPGNVSVTNCCTATASSITLTSDSNEVVCADSDTSINVALDGGSGENAAWVVTDEQTNIISVGDSPSFVLNDVGTYLIWYLNYDGELSAAPVVGANAGEIVTASDCAALSNSIAITVSECCTAEAASISLTTANDESLCANSGESINPVIDGGSGENAVWLITNLEGDIINATNELPIAINDVGNYLVWYLNYNGVLSGGQLTGANATDIINASACVALSNPIEVNVVECCSAAPAVVTISNDTADVLDVCVNSEDLTAVTFSLTSVGNGDNSAWVITDENNIITAVSNDVPSLDLYGSELGTMKIWYLTYDGDLSEAPVAGADAAQIVNDSECAALSNAITIIKDCCCPYSIDFVEENAVCNLGSLIFRPVLVTDESLVLDDGTVVCEKEGLDLVPCSSNLTVLDESGSRALNPITTAADYTATASCTCAPDVTFALPQTIIDNCTDTAPVVAPALAVMDVTESSVTVGYTSNSDVIIEFKNSTDSEFSTIDGTTGMVFLAGLEACSSYDYRSKVLDENGNFIFGDTQSVTTQGCRNINIGNVNLRTLNVSTNTAILTWDNMPGCIYTFYYRVEGGSEWLSYNTSIPFVVLFGLNPCTNYEWALKISDEDVVSERSKTQSISTICQGPRLNNPNTADVKIGDLSDLQNIELDLFVNPTTATLLVNYMGLPISNASIYGVNGQLVNTINISNTALNTIDVSSLDAGVYILVSNFDNGIAKNKFVINK